MAIDDDEFREAAARGQAVIDRFNRTMPLRPWARRDPGPSPLPASYRVGGASHRIWRGLEEMARATLLVHGSRAHDFTENCGESVDPASVIGRMVDEGVLVPAKVDIAGSNRLSLQYKSLRSITTDPWCTAHALFWTYTPGNTTPMRSGVVEQEIDAAMSRKGSGDVVVIEFREAVKFPRFRMAQGERWCMRYGRSDMSQEPEGQAYSDHGVSFAFAGGQCLHSQVIELYRGPDETIAQILTDEGVTLEQARARAEEMAGAPMTPMLPGGDGRADATGAPLRCPYCGCDAPMPSQAATQSVTRQAAYRRVGVACSPCAERSRGRVSIYVPSAAARDIAKATYLGCIISDHRRITAQYLDAARESAAKRAADAIVRTDRLAGLAESSPRASLCFLSEVSDAAALLVRDIELELAAEQAEWAEECASMMRVQRDIMDARATLAEPLQRYRSALREYIDAVQLGRIGQMAGEDHSDVIEVCRWQRDRECRRFLELAWLTDEVHYESDAAAMVRVLKRRAARLSGVPLPVSTDMVDEAQEQLQHRGMGGGPSQSPPPAGRTLLRTVEAQPAQPKEDPRMAAIQVNPERLVYAREQMGLKVAAVQTAINKVRLEQSKGKQAPLKAVEVLSIEREGQCYQWVLDALRSLYKVRAGWLEDMSPMPALPIQRLKDMVGKP